MIPQTEIKQIAALEASEYYAEELHTDKGKLNRLGFSLRLSNFYIGALQVKHTISENRQSRLHGGAKMALSIIRPPYK